MKISFRNSLFLLTMLALAACVTPKTPAQSIYMIEGDYAAALSIEGNYDKLQTCGAVGAPILCKDVKVAKLVRQVDDVAWNAISAAQAAVRTPGFAQDKLTTAVATASNAVTAFASIVKTLGVN